METRGTNEPVTFRSVNGCTATLYHGDCLELLPKLKGIDAVISDPPYGMKWDTDSTRFSGGQRKPGDGRKDYGLVANDDIPFDPQPLIAFKKCVLFGCNHFGSRLPVGTTLVWVKRFDNAFGSFLSDAELAWMKGGHGVYCFRAVPGPSGRGLHPTQKPVALMSWCMDKAKVAAGETVLDPYMGSGTTGIACLRTGRNFIGIELDPRHFATACDRIARELDGQLL